MKIQFNCADCKKPLGMYEGEPFWLTSCLATVETLCETCNKQREIRSNQIKVNKHDPK